MEQLAGDNTRDPPRGRFPPKQNTFPNKLNRMKGTAGAEETPDPHLREGDDQKSLLFTPKTLLLHAAKTRTLIYAPKPTHQLPSSHRHDKHPKAALTLLCTARPPSQGKGRSGGLSPCEDRALQLLQM